MNEALGKQLLSVDHIAHAFAGIYPITATAVKNDEYQGASDYIVTDPPYGLPPDTPGQAIEVPEA